MAGDEESIRGQMRPDGTQMSTEFRKARAKDRIGHFTWYVTEMETTGLVQQAYL